MARQIDREHGFDTGGSAQDGDQAIPTPGAMRVSMDEDIGGHAAPLLAPSSCRRHCEPQRPRGPRDRIGDPPPRDLKPPRESTTCTQIRGAGVRCGRYPDRHSRSARELPRSTPMNRIRAARQALGWTQNDLAKRANVSPRTIHAVEKGRPCRQATKRHILNALGVPWEMRDEYFVRARSVRPAAPAAVGEVRSA
ncbi:MAG: hypothetical protein CL908_17305 [Deltaproteobacteria bacterium]|nr:hypothetical protein [Deltaproteobacteria bacterium]